MENYIEVDTGILNGDIDTLSSDVAELRKEVDILQSEMAELAAMWEGRAHAAFQQQFSADVEFIQSVFQEADKLISCMEYAKKEYDNCEGDIEQLVASIRI